jgi:hypothetical protein
LAAIASPMLPKPMKPIFSGILSPKKGSIADQELEPRN